jgi:hypothetical protein
MLSIQRLQSAKAVRAGQGGEREQVLRARNPEAKGKDNVTDCLSEIASVMTERVQQDREG